VVPVAHNAGDFWPRRGLRKKRGTIHVVFGPPIETANRSASEINDVAQGWIEATMARISDAYPTPAEPSGDGGPAGDRPGAGIADGR
jgi:1-acyl-sn-glycerol-3-phosphate acyltransferase